MNYTYNYRYNQLLKQYLDQPVITDYLGGCGFLDHEYKVAFYMYSNIIGEYKEYACLLDKKTRVAIFQNCLSKVMNANQMAQQQCVDNTKAQAEKYINSKNTETDTAQAVQQWRTDDDQARHSQKKEYDSNHKQSQKVRSIQSIYFNEKNQLILSKISDEITIKELKMISKQLEDLLVEIDGSDKNMTTRDERKEVISNIETGLATIEANISEKIKSMFFDEIMLIIRVEDLNISITELKRKLCELNGLMNKTMHSTELDAVAKNTIVEHINQSINTVATYINFKKSSS